MKNVATESTSKEIMYSQTLYVGKTVDILS